jgi:hypothetical protein
MHEAIAVANEERKERLQVLRASAGHPVSYFSEAEFENAVYGVKRKSLMKVGGEAATAIGYHLLSVTRGYKAAQDIVAFSFDRGVSAYRGKRLFQKSQRKMKRQMMKDYVKESRDVEAEDLVSSELIDDWESSAAEEDEDGWNDVLKTGAAVGPNEKPKPAAFSAVAAGTCSMEAFVDMEGSYMVENGHPMVKRGSMKALYSMIIGSRSGFDG